MVDRIGNARGDNTPRLWDPAYKADGGIVVVRVKATRDHPVPFEDAPETAEDQIDRLIVAGNTAEALEAMGALPDYDKKTRAQQVKLLEQAVRQEGFCRHRRCRLAGPHDLGDDLVDLAVDRLVEMLGQQEIGNAVERFVVDEDGAEQRLLRLDVLRGEAVALVFLGAEAGDVVGHGSRLAFRH